MSFHDIRIPEFIETFAVGRPEFITSRVSTISGREIRSLDREHARQRYMIKNCCLSSVEFEQFSAFFRARRGGSFAFFALGIIQIIKYLISLLPKGMVNYSNFN